MKLNPQQKFWQDPTEVPQEIGDLPNGYLWFCRPEYYLALQEVSIYLAGLITAYVPSNFMILELGCSVGRNLQYLHDLGYQVRGVEINPRSKELAEIHYPDVADKIEIGTAEQFLLDSPNDSYGVIFTQGFLMHIPHSNDWILDEIQRVATRLILTNEVESPGVRENVGFARKIDEYINLPWYQVGSLTKINVRAVTTSTTRIFQRKP